MASLGKALGITRAVECSADAQNMHPCCAGTHGGFLLASSETETGNHNELRITSPLLRREAGRRIGTELSGVSRIAGGSQAIKMPAPIPRISEYAVATSKALLPGCRALGD